MSFAKISHGLDARRTLPNASAYTSGQVDWAWEQQCPSSKAKMLLVYLASHGGQCPSMLDICRITGLAEKTVRKRLKDLISAGLVERVRRYAPDGSCLSNEYRVRGAL